VLEEFREQRAERDRRFLEMLVHSQKDKQ